MFKEAVMDKRLARGWENVAKKNLDRYIEAEALLMEIYENHMQSSPELDEKLIKLLTERGWI